MLGCPWLQLANITKGVCIFIIQPFIHLLGFRSVRLKNAYSEELELATLLVRIQKRIIAVSSPMFDCSPPCYYIQTSTICFVNSLPEGKRDCTPHN